ncbi:MAG: energy-coupling factor transporter transmembrane protein EcfT [Firmicutes bacterium]|nr:energy-coupling factor transporter transmembrane protein EcfT [Bacillota bacterium]
MLDGMTLGQYVPGDSLIHRLDPRTKIIASIVLIVLLFLVEGFVGYLLVASGIMAIIVISRLPLDFVLKGLKPLRLILILTFILHLFMNEGRELARIGPLVMTYEGLIRGILMTARLGLLVLATSLLTLTTSPIRLTDGLEALLNPFSRFGLPAHEVAMMMTIALRFIPTLFEETEKIMKAQKARGADFESGKLTERAKNLVPLLVPLFVSAFRRADELAVAMEARCYRGGEGRTKFHQLALTSADYWSLSLLTLYALVVAVFF